MRVRGEIGRKWSHATIFALAASGCGILLGGLSAWFLGSVALAGLSVVTATTFNFFAPGALVRLFAIGRTVFRYGELLTGHAAALDDQVDHRVRLFSSMAAEPSVRSAGWQLGDPSRLADYIDDVEDVDYARLRAELPTQTLALSVTACASATIVAPLALLPITVLLLGLLYAGYRAAGTGAMAWELTRTMRRSGAATLGVAMASVVPLGAENGWNRVCEQVRSQLDHAQSAALSLRRSLSAVDAIATATGPLACLAVIAAAWLSGARGSDLLIPIFVGFAWLALGESFAGVSRIMVARVRKRAANASLGDISARRKDNAPEPGSIISLGHEALQRRAPDGRVIGTPVALTFHRGIPTVLVGVSGSGKTSLLKQLAGWTMDDNITGDGIPYSAACRQIMSTLCLHDAAILDDSVRANLFAPNAPDGLLWEALAAAEMDGRIARAGGLDAWLRQDVLSLGEAQRLSLARVWLSETPLVLIDEPTEHLDHAQADRIIQRILRRLNGQIVVIASHRKVADTATLELEN